MSVSEGVMIIGAGPYGLSIAAHLRACGVPFRIFGQPMDNWRTKMPKGMLLKSDGFASNLSSPGASFTLRSFAQQQGFPYADEGIPVSLEHFIAYGEAFQRQFAPEVEDRRVIALGRSGDGFAAQLDNGEVATARKAVLAIGISDFAYVPPHLAGAPPEALSHSAQHSDMAAFCGRSLAIIGTGSSAIDLAALAHEAGARVTLVTRRPELHFHGRSTLHRPLAERIRDPNTGIGPGWRSVFYTRAPGWFRWLPEDQRLRVAATSHGPAGGWYMRERVLGHVPVVAGSVPEGVEMRDGEVQLRLRAADGGRQTRTVDHVIAATGYRFDLRRIAFLTPPLRAEIHGPEHTAALSAGFETSAAGLYIVGPGAVHSFGPIFRFVYGCEYVAPRLARHLAGSLRRGASAQPAPAVTAPAGGGRAPRSIAR